MVELPSAARALADQWGFVPTEELPGGYCSRIFANAEWVLKAPWRGEEQISGWRMAVAMSGKGGPRVATWDEASGSLLMERIVPGTKLSESELGDDDGILLFLRFRDAVLATPLDGLLPIAAYHSEPSALGRELLATQSALVPLHGDLHHENILWGGQDWFCIDPKGLCGDPAFEAAAYVRNPWPGLLEVPDLPGLLRTRIERLAHAMACEPWRIWGWSALELEGATEGDAWLPIWEAIREIEPPRA